MRLGRRFFHPALLGMLVTGIPPALLADQIKKGNLSPEEELRARKLMEMIRCPVCESQSIAESTSFLAKEMRNQVRRFIAEGKSREEILAYYRERYGDEIFLVPLDQKKRLLFYLSPFLFFLLGLAGVIYYIYRLNHSPPPSAPNSHSSRA